jgi:hypothetical protein
VTRLTVTLGGRSYVRLGGWKELEMPLVTVFDASQDLEHPTERAGGLEAVWELLHLRGGPPPTSQLPTELGPFTWNPNNPGEKSVGGWAKLALHGNGSVCFNGHFYVPGAPSDVTACVFSVRAGDETVYTFVRGWSQENFDDGTRDRMPARRRGALAERFRPMATPTAEPPTLWWQVRVVSTEAHAAHDVETACRRAGGWMPTY